MPVEHARRCISATHPCAKNSNVSRRNSGNEVVHRPRLTTHTPTGHETFMIAMVGSTETIMAPEVVVVGEEDSVVGG